MYERRLTGLVQVNSLSIELLECIECLGFTSSFSNQKGYMQLGTIFWGKLCILV